MIAKILLGSRDKKVVSLGLDSISTYGIMKSTSEERVNNLIARLIDLDMIMLDPEFGGLSITKNSYPVLFGEERLVMSFKEPPRVEKRRKKNKDNAFEEFPVDVALFDSLRSLRYDIATEEQVPAYIIFSNASLYDMVQKKPRSYGEFLSVVGVGRVKAARYADRFIERISNFEKSHENNKTEN